MVQPGTLHSEPGDGCPRGGLVWQREGTGFYFGVEVEDLGLAEEVQDGGVGEVQAQEALGGVLVGGHRKEGFALGAEAGLYYGGVTLAGVKRLRKTLRAGQA
jgi:hypothetical protein